MIIFDMRKLYKIQISAFINKILMEDRHTLFVYTLSLAAFALKWKAE